MLNDVAMDKCHPNNILGSLKVNFGARFALRESLLAASEEVYQECALELFDEK